MRLSEGVGALDLMLPAGAADKLDAYLNLLAKWNKAYNLTAIRDPEEMVTHHLLDSLAVLPCLDQSITKEQQYCLADIGSGAGLPGLVLAIARPGWTVTSIEAVGKKVAFQRQVKMELGLNNVTIHGGRVEGVKDRFDAVISRAFASLQDFVRLAGHLTERLWAMKGDYPANEVAGLPSTWQIAACHELNVPGLGARRHLLQLERN